MRAHGAFRDQVGSKTEKKNKVVATVINWASEPRMQVLEGVYTTWATQLHLIYIS